MSVTTLLFLALFITGVILTLRDPYWGIALYIFEWHNHPPYMWWGSALPDLRWSMTVAVITLVSLIINQKKLKPLRGSTYNIIWWLVAMTLWMYFISMFFAISPRDSFKRAENFFKLTVQITLMMYLVRDISHHKTVIYTLVASVANFGRVAWQRGSNRYLGVIAPNSTEENAISAHVAAVMPFFGLYILTGKKWEKIFTLLAMPFLVNLIILANSRASFLAVMVVGFLTLIWVKGKLRWQVLLGLVAGAGLFLMLGSESFWARQQTMQSYEQEGSAMSRFYLWNGAIKMWLDYPMGLGGEGFEELAIDYIPELAEDMREEGAKTVHNTFFLILVEWGPVGVIIFFGFTFHMFFILGRIRKNSKLTPYYRYYVDAMAIQMGILALTAAGIFHNRFYSEVYYWFGAFATALANLQRHDILTENAEHIKRIEEEKAAALALEEQRKKR